MIFLSTAVRNSIREHPPDDSVSRADVKAGIPVRDSSRALLPDPELEHGPARRSELKHELRIGEKNERRRAPPGLVLDCFPWNGKTTFPQESINKPKCFFFSRKRCLSEFDEVNTIVFFL